ncbi:hypothetical protein RAZWK3B_12724 [Roseobacter sp. AzwK-3b]|uniref:class I SAM-dependent methyltransferase n=1 Tax=Roseobacter sp. AzwK-3b TaxID=351016 RepID=UPI000156AEE9|nr:class I SAM-dependent methyltransferase [Roseobacter sp. AzwK-3b]EDM69486.1 hypothetical protein RAZWK3B_12724 [Roseobacter sp. AzwK-3b]
MAFTADWLALREPADHAARDSTLLRRAAKAAGATPVILDLGCGTGSTVRAMAPHLPAGTTWRLVDNDPALLALAAKAAGPETRTYSLDLADPGALPLGGVTLVTASALLDLMPRDWVAALAARLTVPFYAALSYDGQMSWEPADPLDAPVTEAFNRHQLSDKGLGPALGPGAVTASTAIFDAAGFDVAQADSPWALGPDTATLHASLLEGIATAAAETGLAEALDWGQRRRDRAVQTICTIGHGDILALPRSLSTETTHAAD